MLSHNKLLSVDVLLSVELSSTPSCKYRPEGDTVSVLPNRYWWSAATVKMHSRTVSNNYSASTTSLFSRSQDNVFTARNTTTDAHSTVPLPNPNSSNPLNLENDARPNNAISTGTRSPSGLCNFHNLEYAVNQRYRYNTACHKNLKTLQQSIGEKKRPCLFDAARIFGGSECSHEVYNGVCSFHWSMMNLRVGVCEQYNTHDNIEGCFQHYDMLVDVAIPDRALIPIFPDICSQTSMWDLMFGFTYATNRGLLTTKVNEGAAMAYALYYMMDNHCYVEFLARSTYWVQNMTEYLMAFVFYNDELQKDMYASRFPVEQNTDTTTVLKNLFTKNVYVQDMIFDVARPSIQIPDGVQLTERDSQMVRNMPPMSTDNTDTLETVTTARANHRSKPYKKFHIFVAPLILSLRPSSYVTDLFLYGAPPVVGVFNIRFNDTTAGGGHSVFAIQGPIQYGVSMSRGQRSLPFTNNNMPVCTQAYVATLGAVSNIDVTEDRIFASELASYADFTIADSEKLFSMNSLR